MYGPPRLVDRIADQFRSVLTRMQEMTIKVRDTTVRLEKYGVDPWSICGDVLATLNPAEDLFLQGRTGFQTDEYSVKSKPSVFKVLGFQNGMCAGTRSRSQDRVTRKNGSQDSSV